MRDGAVRRTVLCLVVLMLGAACSARSQAVDPCDGLDPVLTESTFVLVLDPEQGARTSSPFTIRGCSRTFESNVVWELRGRDGRVLASGNAMGGGFSGAAPFEVSATFSVTAPEVGHLTVFEPDESDGEGFPPPRVVLPLVLVPGA